MKADMSEPALHFHGGFDAREEHEAESRGYCSDVAAVFEDGKSFELVFYDPVRLSQDLQTLNEQGRTGIAERGLIVVPLVTKNNMQRAIKEAYESGYFGASLPGSQE